MAAVYSFSRAHNFFRRSLVAFINALQIIIYDDETRSFAFAQHEIGFHHRSIDVLSDFVLSFATEWSGVGVKQK